MEEQNIKEEIEKKRKELETLRSKLDKKLKLENTDKDNLMIGIRSNGRKYSVRKNRDRFFYPDEWMKFYDNLKDSQKATFDILINTGARINEAIHIKTSDIDFERNTIILRVTKTKAKKGEKYSRPRTISISPQFSKKLKKYCRDNKLINTRGGIDNDSYIGLLSKSASNTALKKGLEKAKIKNPYEFSLHNIRKSHGNWLKALGVESNEICTRLGHDYNTFLKSYSSPDIFNYNDLNKMRLILGDLYRR